MLCSYQGHEVYLALALPFSKIHGGHGFELKNRIFVRFGYSILKNGSLVYWVAVVVATYCEGDTMREIFHM